MKKGEEGSGDLSKKEADEYWDKKDKSSETWGAAIRCHNYR